jgi:hypothetical protein
MGMKAKHRNPSFCQQIDGCQAPMYKTQGFHPTSLPLLGVHAMLDVTRGSVLFLSTLRITISDQGGCMLWTAELDRGEFGEGRW